MISSNVVNSDCSPGIKVSIPESGITAFVILGSQDSIFEIKLKTLVIILVSLIDFFHVYDILGPYRPIL